MIYIKVPYNQFATRERREYLGELVADGDFVKLYTVDSPIQCNRQPKHELPVSTWIKTGNKKLSSIMR